MQKKKVGRSAPKPQIHAPNSSEIESHLMLSYKFIVYSSVLKYGISPFVRAPIFNTTYLKISL